MKPKVKIKKESIENFDFMKTNKDNLKNIRFRMWKKFNISTFQG